MWRGAYAFLLFVRLYFALCPSYIHPDEHFQGPEVIAGKRREQPTVPYTSILTIPQAKSSAGLLIEPGSLRPRIPSAASSRSPWPMDSP